MHKSLLAAVGLIGAAMITTTASAAPLGGLAAGASADAGIVHQIHDGNVHRSCQRGPGGWHYHSRWRGRVACRPVSPGKLWIWRSEGSRVGWWHPRERRWHD